MRSPTNKETGDRRKTERREASDRRSETMRAATGERRVVDQRGLVESMVDALEDILEWERTSERGLRAAPSVTDVSRHH